MAESTLSVTFTDLRRYCGRQAGFSGLDDPETNWVAKQKLLVKDAINAGLRRFYSAHPWRFMRPIATLTTVAPYSTGTVTIVSGVVTLAGGTFPTTAAAGEFVVEGNSYDVNTRDSGTQLTLTDTSLNVSAGATYSLQQSLYTLPDDFGGIEGPLTYPPGSSQWFPPVHHIGESQIRQSQLAAGWVTGQPIQFSVRTKAYSPITGHRQEAILNPAPDAVYILTYQYTARPNELSTTNLYPLGGPEHSQTIVEACLSEMESQLEDTAGIHEQKYQLALAQSIQWDKNAFTPDSLGYNGDSSEGCGYYDQRGMQAPMFEGQVYY